MKFKKLRFFLFLFSIALILNVKGFAAGFEIPASMNLSPQEQPNKQALIPASNNSGITVGLHEDFTGEELPDDWQNNELGDEGHGWNLLGSMIWTNSWQNEDFHVAGELITPAVDCSQMEDVVLLGVQLHYVYVPSELIDASIHISTDGNNWDAVTEFTTSSGGQNYLEYDITEFALGEDEIYVKFLYNDQEERRGYWQIHEVIIYSPDEPEFSIEPELSEYDFETIVLGDNSDPKSFEVKNTGTGVLTVNEPVLDNTDDFFLIFDSSDFPAQLEFEEVVSFEVVFSPENDGDLSAILSLPFNDGEDQVFNIDFFGTGFDPTITEFPWTEIFQQFEFPVIGWSFINGVEGAHWEGTGVNSHTGSRAVRAYYGPSSDYKANEWFITPAIDLDSPGAELLFFYVMSTFEPNGIRERLEVWILDDIDEDAEELPNNGEFLGEFFAQEEWVRKSIDISMYSGLKHIAFRYHIDQTSGWNHVYLDNVNIEEIVTFNLTMLDPVGEEGKVTPEAGEHTFYAFEEISLKAEAEHAWTWNFDFWELDGEFYSSNSDTIITIEEDHTVQGFFVESDPVVLTMEDVQGAGTVKPWQGDHSFVSGAEITIEAIPDQGWQFENWLKNGESFSSQTQQPLLMEENVNIQAVFIESSSHSVTFEVIDQDGEPIDNAEITFDGQTNAAGDYVFQDVVPGNYLFNVAADEYFNTGGEVTVFDNDVTQQVGMELLPDETFDVTFLVTDVDGSSVGEAVVFLNGFNNAPGDYVFEDIPSGSHCYKVTKSGYFPLAGELTVSDEDLVFEVTLINDSRIFYEDFADNILPGGWQVFTHGDEGLSWSFEEEIAKISPNEDHHVSASLVSPSIDINQVDALILGMKHFYNPYQQTQAEIRISYDGLTWTTVKNFGGDSEGDLDLPYHEYHLTNHIDDSQDNIYIAFFFNSIESLNSFFNWQIDQVELFEPTPHNLMVQDVSPNKYVESGESHTYELTLLNAGGLEDEFHITMLEGDWAYTFPENITLAGGTSSVIEVEVAVPSGLYMGDTDLLLLSIQSQGDPEVQKEIAFITVAIGPIYSDYYENFNIVTPPDIPGGWHKRVESSAYWARIQTEANPSIDPVSPPNHLRFNNSSDDEAELILIAPEIDDNRHLSEFRVRFWLRNSNNTALLIGTTDNPNGEFRLLKEFSSQTHFGWEEFMYSFEDYQGQDTYIAFKQKVIQENTALHLDDVNVEIIPPPIISLEPGLLDFGEQPEKTESWPDSLTITNTGHGELIIEDFSLDNTDDFYLDYNPSDLPVNLEWNESYTFHVFFIPSSAGNKTGEINITYNDGEEQAFYVPLEGVGKERPVGATCDNPIMVDLPVIDYEGTTQGYYFDYGYNYITPASWELLGNDKVFSFSLEEESFVSGDIYGRQPHPVHTNNRSGMFITQDCPNPNNPAQVLVAAIPQNGWSFDNHLLEAGDYLVIISSNYIPDPEQEPWIDFEFNLSAETAPEVYEIGIKVVEDSTEEMPLEGANILLVGEHYNEEGNSDQNGEVVFDLHGGNYSIQVSAGGYFPVQQEVLIEEDKEIVIRMQEPIWDPSELAINTEEYDPGEAFFTWSPHPTGNPWEESFEDIFPPSGWSQIVTNDGGLDPDADGADWLFTWQKYGVVGFVDGAVEPIEGEYQAFVHWSWDMQDEWLISHEFTAPAEDLVFWYYGRNGSNNQDFFVKISTDNGETWEPIWNASDLPWGTNHYDYPAVIDLSLYGDQDIRLAWNAYAEYGLDGAFLIDDISVGDMRLRVEDLKYVSKSRPTGFDSEQTGETALAFNRDGKAPPAVQWEDMEYTALSSRYFIGFNIYLDDLNAPITAGIEDSYYLFTQLGEGEYTAGVEAVYSTGVSNIITLDFEIEDGDDGTFVHEPADVELTVFPNPTRDHLNINADERISRVLIININGETMKAVAPDAEELKLNMGDLTPGIYLIKVYTQKGIATKRVQVL